MTNNPKNRQQWIFDLLEAIKHNIKKKWKILN